MNRQVLRGLTLAILLIGATAAAGQPPAEDVSPRVRGLLAQMTREEKLAVIRGTREPEATFMGQAGWIRGVPRLGIPDLRFADGPPGVLVRRASTGMPATLAMAATFSRAVSSIGCGLVTAGDTTQGSFESRARRRANFRGDVLVFAAVLENIHANFAREHSASPPCATSLNHLSQKHKGGQCRR